MAVHDHMRNYLLEQFPVILESYEFQQSVVCFLRQSEIKWVMFQILVEIQIESFSLNILLQNQLRILVFLFTFVEIEHFQHNLVNIHHLIMFICQLEFHQNLQSLLLFIQSLHSTQLQVDLLNILLCFILRHILYIILNLLLIQILFLFLHLLECFYFLFLSIQLPQFLHVLRFSFNHCCFLFQHIKLGLIHLLLKILLIGVQILTL